MTDIDIVIERLRQTALGIGNCATHWEDCSYTHGWCAVLALIERLKQVEDERNNLLDRLTCMCGDDMDRHPHGDGHSPTSMYDHYRLEWDDMKQQLSDAEAQRDRLEAAARAALDARIGSHDHWDSTMQRGRGCEVCIAQRAASSKLRDALSGIQESEIND